MKSRLDNQLKRWVEAAPGGPGLPISAYEEERQKGVQVKPVHQDSQSDRGIVLRDRSQAHRYPQLAGHPSVGQIDFLCSCCWAEGIGPDMNSNTEFPLAFPLSWGRLIAGYCGIILAGIALVSQIYHLNERPPNGVLMWWLGITLFYLLESLPLQYLSLAAGLTWLEWNRGTPILFGISPAGDMVCVFT